MRSRLHPLRVLVGLAATFCGCASEGLGTSISDAFHQTVQFLTPHEDEHNINKATNDEWNDVGKQARADRPVQQQNDPVRNLFVSPRAQEIERSLGVD